MPLQQLDIRWAKHLEPDDKEKFVQAVRHDTLVLGRLLAILEEELASLERQETTENSFDNPNWPYKQAFSNGQKNGIKKVVTLLNFLKD